MTELEQILSTREGRGELQGYFAGLLRALDFGTLEGKLTAQLADNPSSFAPLCRASNLEGVTVTGWEDLHADIAALDRRGKPCTAVGIDITGHNDGDEPAFEVALYDDSAFAFSTADRDALLAVSGGYPVPWQGCFAEIDSVLECDGLALLHRAIRSYPHRWESVGAELPRDYAGFVLALWWLYLRIHQAVADALATYGLPRAMPVILDEHDFGPQVGAVHMAAQIADTGARTARILDARDQASRLHHDRVTEQSIMEIREKRAAVRSWTFWRNRAQRRNAIELIEASDKLMFADVVSTRGQHSVWLLSDREFEILLDRYREHRRPGSSLDPHPDPGEDRSQLHLLFLQHALEFGGRAVQREFLASRRRAA